MELLGLISLSICTIITTSVCWYTRDGPLCVLKRNGMHVFQQLVLPATLLTFLSGSNLAHFSLFLSSLSDCHNAFALVVRPPTEQENLLFSFQLTTEDTVKSTWLKMLCRHVANTICKADAVREAEWDSGPLSRYRLIGLGWRAPPENTCCLSVCSSH